jgi:3-oxoacyl-[acyl-carrier protein] reductase
MVELAGKRALVTGGSRGIGAAIALALAEKGADVAITYNLSPERAAEVVRSVEAKGRRGFAIAADSANAARVKQSVGEAAERLGGLDILVNNAAIFRTGPFAEASLVDVEAMLDVNVRSVVLASQAAMPHLKKGGRIISIGSCLAERVPFPGMTVYSMSKSALLAFTRGLARELGPQGITVNVVHPGPTPLGHYGSPEDVAAAVAFLASPAAQQITGTGISVDGGVNA